MCGGGGGGVGGAVYQCHHDVHIVPEFQGWSEWMRH